jgi:hypothetical protein
MAWFSPQGFSFLREALGDGANFPGLVVARRSEMPDIRRSSLLDADKLATVAVVLIVLTGPNHSEAVRLKLVISLFRQAAFAGCAAGTLPATVWIQPGPVRKHARNFHPGSCAHRSRCSHAPSELL